MELLRDVVVLVHIVGFALTFGAWAVQAVAQEFRFTPLMNYGLLVSLLTGLALAAPWPAGVELNYVKISIKLAIVVALGAVLGIGSARQRKSGEPVNTALFAAVGLLTLTAAGVAVIA
ncbi:MAG TPA: Fe-S protein [Mycobacterium sp.]|nr:MAG: Fe-S protein [Mycobacterium sp.]HOB49365.1 Fe-S protein [Mycobacterium sp.]HPZ94446.1 Fe-S protein [Mycobacterium sp.]HQE15041.1 Fe-S protein [Mycobacterium sp.]